MLNTVSDRYGDVLTDIEHQVLEQFRNASAAAQCLFVRLISRTGPWFRESKLRYPEIGPLSPVIDELLAVGFAELAEGLPANLIGCLFRRTEIESAFCDVLQNPSSSKAHLLQDITSLGLHDDVLLQRVSDGQRVIAARHRDLVDLLQLLFFGNRHQSLTEFVLQDLGLTRYFPYSLEHTERLFPNRAAIDEALLLAELADRRYTLLETGATGTLPALAADVLKVGLLHECNRPRWERLCNRLGRDLERLDALDLALELYSCGEQYPARERRARIYERQQLFEKACHVCDQIISAPHCEAEAEAALRILPRLQRKRGMPVDNRPKDRFDTVEITLPNSGERVENACAGYLANQWNAVHYVENRLLNALFGLAFWQQIFTPIRGVFHHPFQSVPTDMYTGDFQRRRAPALMARMAQLRCTDLSCELLDAYQRFNGYQCQWVHWRAIDSALVEHATSVIPGEHLLSIFNRMLFDPRENRRGLPDLLALGDNHGDYCLIEVKGPGDTLQDNQKRWLRFFADEHIPARVARVRYSNE